MSKENPLSHHSYVMTISSKIFITSTTVNGGSLIICNRKWRVPSRKFTISTKKKKKNLGVEILIFRLMAVEVDLRNVKR